MRTTLTLLCFLSVSLATLSAPAALAAAPEMQGPESLRVVTEPIKPFVIKEGDEYSGFSVDIWREVATRAELPYEFYTVTTVEAQLDAVQQGQADLGISALTMTPEREEILDFSHPFFFTGLQIMVPAGRYSLLDTMLGLLSWELLAIIGGFLCIIILVAHIVWFFERHLDQDFRKTYWLGIWDALWWTIVTVSTVGYGDKTPRGPIGRLLGMIWIIVGLFLIAHFTASVAAHATLQGLYSAIHGVSDLAGKRVVTVADSPSAEYLTQRGIQYVTVSQLADAYRMVEENTADALVYDAPILLYYAATAGRGKVRVVGTQFAMTPYGIILPNESPYREAINRALLAIYADGTYQTLYDKWFVQAQY